MTVLPRLRRHTDGRVAIHTNNGLDFCWFVVSQCSWATDANVAGDGWVELFVAELPEPDAEGAWSLPGGSGVLTATADGIALDARPWPGDVEELRVEALSMLAALAACERYRAERETAQ